MYSSLKIAKEIGECTRWTLKQTHINFLTHHVHLTTSIGITNTLQRNSSLEQLMSQADKNLYRAKAKGRYKAIG